jgi:hypothetical protein
MSTTDIEAPPSAETNEDPQALVKYWLDQIAFSERKRKPFITRGRQIVKRYKNKRTLPVTGIPLAQRRMNVLWSNVQTQKPVLFNQVPNANVSRRNPASKDPVGRMAAIVLQNCLQNSLGMEDFAHVINQVVEDRLLPGSGTAMVEYVPTIEKDEIGWQAAETRYIHWEDTITNMARTPQEVWFWGYATYLTRDEVRDQVLKDGGDKQTAQKISQEIALDHKEDKSSSSEAMSKAVVWVIWDSKSKRVLHIATGYTEAPIGVLEPPVDFDGFYPAPRPLVATTSTDSTVPTPDFDQYVDQADEIDMLTQRIGLLAKACRLRGFYPADMDSIKTLMENTGDNDLVPVSNWAMFSERGGAQNVIGYLPIKDIAACLQECISARNDAIEIMYQITGISDIMRGDTEAQETATAQQLKANFGGSRVRESQKDVQRFIRDLLRRKAEVICEHFQLKTIQAMAGVNLLTDQQKQQTLEIIQKLQGYQQQVAQAQQQGMQPPPPPGLPQPPPSVLEALKEPTWEQVMAVLQNEKTRGFVIDVETDSTIEPDQQAQQQRVTEFVTAVVSFLEAAAQIVPVMPQATPMLGEVLGWASRQFKVGDTIQTAIDEFVDDAKKAAAAPKPPSPQDQKAQADVAVAQTGVKTAVIKANAEQTKAQLSVTQAALEHRAAAQEMTQEQQQSAQEHQQNMIEGAQKAALAERQHQQAMEQARQKPNVGAQ